MLNQTPSAFRQLIQADAARRRPRPLALRYVIFGGEALELQSLRPWFERHGDEPPRLVNMYGITETTVHVTYRPLTRADVEAGARQRDRRADPGPAALPARPRGCSRCPIGVPGEIYVGGAGVARGYLEPAGADRRALRARPVRPRAGRAALPHRRPGALAARRRPRVPRPHRPPGEDPRLPHRARRDRGGARRRTRRCARPWSSRARTRPGDKRLVAYVVADAEPAARSTSCARACAARAARLHGAGRLRRARRAAAHRERQGRPQGTAGARAARAQARARLRRAAHRRGEDAGRHLGARCCGVERVGRRRQLLRARRRLDPQHPGHRARARRPALRITPEQLFRAPDHRRAGAWPSRRSRSEVLPSRQALTGPVPLDAHPALVLRAGSAGAAALEPGVRCSRSPRDLDRARARGRCARARSSTTTRCGCGSRDADGRVAAGVRRR